jgi:hypothetical protein
LLRAEVRSLRDENQRLRDQMTTMMTHQSTTSRILATLQQQREQQEREQREQEREREREHQHQQHQRNRLHQPRPQSAQHLPPMALFRSSASSTMPAVALMEAMHEMPFLRDYPMLTGFAVPDFRYASHTTQRRGTTRHTRAHCDVAYVSGGQISGHCGRVRVGVRPSAADDHLRQRSHVPTERVLPGTPPVLSLSPSRFRFRFRSLIFAIRSSAWVQDQLIGAPITALIVLQETHRRVLGPYITRQYALPTPEESEIYFQLPPFYTIFILLNTFCMPRAGSQARLARCSTSTT